MKIVLIGAGNLATHLGKALHAAGHDMVQVFSRTMQSAETLASLLDAERSRIFRRCVMMPMCISSR